MTYNPWPLGKLPLDSQRPEIGILKELGYSINDPRDAVDIFESTVANFTGSKYCVSVDCCSHGIFLCLKYLNAQGIIEIPSMTYVSIPMQIIHAGCKLEFSNEDWVGRYQLKPYPIWDCALEFSKGMFKKEFEVLSFQIKKTLPIGRGGAILMNDQNAYKWLKKACYDGRDLNIPYDDDRFSELGWHFYMTPEDAARGLILFQKISEFNPPSVERPIYHYSDLSKREVFKPFLGR